MLSLKSLPFIFQLINKSWICSKYLSGGEKKVYFQLGTLEQVSDIQGPFPF